MADYDYTCHTLNAQGKKVEVKYGITTQIAQHLACTMGYKRHKGENDKSEQLLYVPTTWQKLPTRTNDLGGNYPSLPISYY